jgi:hypothetical protein
MRIFVQDQGARKILPQAYDRYSEDKIAYLPAQLRHPSFAGTVRHTHDTDHAGPPRYTNDDDLYPKTAKEAKSPMDFEPAQQQESLLGTLIAISITPQFANYLDAIRSDKYLL